jgi:hypothetical protein
MSAPFGAAKAESREAAAPVLASAIVNGMAKRNPWTASKAALLDEFDRNLAAGREALAGAREDHFSATIPAVSMTCPAIPRARVMSGAAAQ